MTDSLTVSMDRSVATIRFDRPDIGNAVTPGQAVELLDALEQLTAEGEARVLILTGSGSSFNVGAYRRPAAGIAPAQADEDPVGRYERLIPTMRRVLDLLRSPDLVVIAAVNGACAGAGVCLALAADLRYAADSAGFNTAFLEAGLSGELGAIWLAVRQVGLARAKELFLLPRRRTAEEMATLGLVHEVVPADALDAKVSEVARAFLGFPPIALRGMKANFEDALREPLDEYLPSEHGRMLDCLRK